MRSTTSLPVVGAGLRINSVGFRVLEGNAGKGESGWRAAEIFGVLCERLNVSRHCFSCGSWLAWRNNTKLRDPRPARCSLIGARLIFNKNYNVDGKRGGARARARADAAAGERKRKKEKSAEIKKFTRCPGGTRWPRNLKLRKLGNRTTGSALAHIAFTLGNLIAIAFRTLHPASIAVLIQRGSLWTASVVITLLCH